MLYNVFQVGNFLVHQDEVIALFCINKDKPEIKCNGKCHLSKQLLDEASSSSNEKDVLPAPILSLLFVYSPPCQNSLELFFEYKRNMTIFRDELTIDSFFKITTPPPETAA